MFIIQEELKKMPDNPGVYIMKDKKGEIIYIGKAVVLKNRVRQYFQSLKNQTPKVKAMVPQIHEFEYIVTDTEIEALILECNLIKKHKPRFNIRLKDDKTYPYIKVTVNEKYPRVLVTRKVQRDGAKYFGPYTSEFAVKEIMDLIKTLFPVRSCSRPLAGEPTNGRPCLNYYIHQCLGPCQGNIKTHEYDTLVTDICDFLKGGQSDILKRLETDMKGAAANLEFEKAARFRDKINSLKHLEQKQKIVSASMVDQDIIAFARKDKDICAQIFFVRNGKLIGREHFILEVTADETDGEILTEFVKQFYSRAAYVPRQIILQAEIDEAHVIEKWLTDKRGARTYIQVPKRGEKLRLVGMVRENASIELARFRDRIRKRELLANEGSKKLAQLLSLDKIPTRIEAYDISNMGNMEIVASMVVFEKGYPKKSDYRRFRIKSTDIQNDYQSMQEVVYRRFRRGQGEDGDKTAAKEKGRFGENPDLILVDGGRGHVNAVENVLDRLGIDILVYGMVKDEKHKTRGIVSKRHEYEIKSDLVLLRFVSAIQNEAHRFALEYNKKLREKRYKKSVLDEIKGIGPKRKKGLIKHFGSIKGIKKANVGELASVDGINKELAERIYKYFR
ncbi:MAG: excinuclease ABC subunit UvrC [Clostridium sp.]|nr:excinuclease ABC subunit UvrC [Clostridium sp.]